MYVVQFVYFIFFVHDIRRDVHDGIYHDVLDDIYRGVHDDVYRGAERERQRWRAAQHGGGRLSGILPGILEMKGIVNRPCEQCTIGFA